MTDLKTKMVTIRVDPEYHDRLKRNARFCGWSLSELMLRATNKLLVETHTQLLETFERFADKGQKGEYKKYIAWEKGERDYFNDALRAIVDDEEFEKGHLEAIQTARLVAADRP